MWIMITVYFFHLDFIRNIEYSNSRLPKGETKLY